MSFSFNFAGDDIDESIDQSNEPEVVGAQAASVNGRAEQPDLVEVVQHDLQSMVCVFHFQTLFLAETKISYPLLFARCCS